MAVIFYDGFDIYNVATSQTYDLITPALRYTMSGLWYNHITYSTGFDNIGRSIVFGNNNVADNSIRLPLNTPLTAFSIGAHIYPTYGIAVGIDIFTIQSADTNNTIRLTTVSNNPNSLNLIVNGQNNLLTFIDPLDQNMWQHIELQGTVVSGNSITVNLYIGGSFAATWSGAGFGVLPYAWTTFYVGKRGGGGTGGYRIDNLFVTDGDHLGVVEVKTLTPSADTAQKDGLAIIGNDNFSLINNYSTPMTLNYVAFPIQSTSDEYDLTDPGILPDDYDVLSAQGISVMKQSATSTLINGYVGLSSSGSDSNGTPVVLDQTNYKLINGPITITDPSTSTTWTVAGINDLKMIVGRALD